MVTTWKLVWQYHLDYKHLHMLNNQISVSYSTIWCMDICICWTIKLVWQYHLEYKHLHMFNTQGGIKLQYGHSMNGYSFLHFFPYMTIIDASTICSAKIPYTFAISIVSLQLFLLLLIRLRRIVLDCIQKDSIWFFHSQRAISFYHGEQWEQAHFLCFFIYRATNITSQRSIWRCIFCLNGCRN